MTINRLYISNTSISTFKNCKKKFKYRYLDKLPNEVLKSPNLSLGTTIHNTLAEFNRLPQTEQLYEVIVPLYKKHWKNDGYKTQTEKETYYQKGLEMLKSYCDDRKDLGETLFCEKMIFYNVNANLTLCGKIDKVFKTTDAKIELLDYKTTNSPCDEIDFINDMQLPVYLILTKYQLGNYPNVISYYYLSSNTKVSLELNDEILNYCIENLRNTIKEIKSEHAFELTPSFLCNSSCEFINSCDLLKRDIGVISELTI